ncbi:MAG TPA: sodium-dependent transporter [Smithellaceae bacterium]|nr:sodium-dependent transporter [Smithellaceae bacterium]HRS89099.1 sodium-dependent transporter [Smithellaceae bacterium]HRV26007.1 sodium-dependent transporter [Smithellaceae bacterium]
MSNPKKSREHWATRAGFILAAAGSAVGLGNIWRFPYMTGEHGGAAFIVIYLIAILLIGYPLVVNETILGRASQKSPVGAFKSLAPQSPWWLVGALGVFTGFVILSYYIVVAGWSIAYIYKVIVATTTQGIDHAQVFKQHIASVWEPLIWQAVFMLLTIGIIASGVINGIQRWSTILMPILFVLLIVLIIRAITLPGAGAGLSYYLKPDFSEVTGRTLLGAISQAFFSLSLGMGVFITYGSYLKKNDEIPVSSASIVGLDTIVALLAGFAIFPAVFALGFAPGAGPGLVFITLPAVFAQMPFGIIFGVLFFVLLGIAALTSAISLLEVVSAWLIDEKGWKRKQAAIVMGFIIFVVGIPASLGYSVLSGVSFPGLGTDLLDTYDWFANSIFLPLGGLLSAIFVGYVWGAKKAVREANRGCAGFTIGKWWVFLLRYFVPAMIILIMAAGVYDTFIK